MRLLRGEEMRATCIPLRVVRRAIFALLTYATLAISATLLYLYTGGVNDAPVLVLGASTVASLVAASAILYTGVSESPWSILTIIYPLAGIAVYKAASKAMEVGDECRAIALLSPFLTILIPLSAVLCLQPPRRAYTPERRAEHGAAPGASDTAVSHGGG